MKKHTIKKIPLKTKEQHEIEELQMAMKDLIKICIRLHKEIKELKNEQKH